jgi:hypothetical protein
MLGDINSECYVAPLKVYPMRMLGDVIGLTDECVKLGTLPCTAGISSSDDVRVMTSPTIECSNLGTHPIHSF